MLYQTIPYELCRCEMKDVHGLQSFISTHSEESASLLFILCLQYQMPLTSPFSKDRSDISLEEFNMFTPATRKLSVNERMSSHCSNCCFAIVCCLTSQQHRVYLRDGSAQTILRAATLRQKLKTKLSISPSHSILTPGQPVPALTL